MSGSKGVVRGAAGGGDRGGMNGSDGVMRGAAGSGEGVMRALQAAA